MVLLVLAAIWAAVLIPPALRSRAEGRPGDSISAFHRQLSVLRRTGPRSQRLAIGDHSSRPSAPLAPPLAPPPRVNGTAAARSPRGPRSLASPAWAGMRAPGMSSSRSRTLRRRRDVLAALVVAAAVTLVLGALPMLRMLWAAHLVFDVLLVA